MKRISLSAIKNNIKFLLQNDLKHKMVSDLHHLKQELLLYKIISATNLDWQKKNNASIEFLKNINNKITVSDVQILEVKKSLLLSEIINNPNKEFQEKYKTEIENLQKNNDLSVFPYKQIKHLRNVSSGYDNTKMLPYVRHNNKRLYFPKSYSLQKAHSMYMYYIQTENILGGNFSEKSPHQYESKKCFVKEGDILIDIGCAEALFSLHYIDKVKKAYLIESDPGWLDALQATFEPYKKKVCIINKLIAAEDSETSVGIRSILQKENPDNLFIKMDIEGNEKEVAKSCLDFFKINKWGNVKMCCCTYHFQEDAKALESLFTSANFSTDFSDGYMLFYYDDLEYPYFRKGIIRAIN